jgi:UMF1 family MFS transporter
MSVVLAEASRLGQVSWALFDWANQPFFTVVTTFIFAPYLANVVIGDPVQGQTVWAFTQSTAGIVIAILSPFLGAMADAGGRRKPYILAFQLLLAAGCAALWWAYPGRPDLAGPIGWAIVVALSGRATAWMAPFTIGVVTAATQSNRLGVACVLVFLVLGFALLWPVREARAEAIAED